MTNTSAKTLLIALLCTATIPAQVPCGSPAPPGNCAALVPGTPLPFLNTAAASRLDLSKSSAFEIVILGHSESKGYHTTLTQLIRNNPLVPGKSFRVFNDYLGGNEAWRWVTRGQPGYNKITRVLSRQRSPMIVLGLFSNNVTYPIRSPSTADANYLRFASELEAISDRLYSAGTGAMMVYLSSHRYKPGNLLPCYYEKCSLGYAIQQMASKNKAYVKAGPEQHDLHWCCFPTCYASDRAHTNAIGDQLMAQTWYNFLLREMTGAVMEPYGEASAGSGSIKPVLSPAGGAPRLGNSSFSLSISMALGGAPLAYILGARQQAGPLLASFDILVFNTATGSGAGQGSHKLSTGVPNDKSLLGVGVFVQGAIADPQSAYLGHALTQGLRLVIGG